MPTELQATTLRLCLEKIIDYRGKTPKKLGSDWTNEGYRALSALNVKDSGLTSTETIRCVDASTYKKWMKDEVKRGDILLTSEAPAGEVMIWDSDEKIVLSQRLFCLRTNKRFDNRFIKYYLQSPTGKREVNRTRSGSTVAGISAEMFDQIQVLHPEIRAQQKIAAVLSAIDAKIDLNTRINAELEALAKTIYEYWFVQFDFPDAKGRPYKTSGGKMVWNEALKREIPAGWENGRLSDALHLEYGKPLKDSDRSGLGFPVMGSNGTVGYHNAYLVEGPGIVVGRKGTAGAVTYSHENFFPIDTTYYVKPKLDYGFQFLHQLLTSLQLTRLNGDSAVPGLNRDNAHRLPVVLPTSDMVAKYDSVAKPLMQKIRGGLTENRELTQLRDWLLPLLMNGQVKPPGL